MSEEKISECKQLILKTLRSKKYVHFAELLKLTKQKHFDRRIRELKSEQGYDIEIKFIDGDPYYVLKSERRNPKIKRTYLKKNLKKIRLLKIRSHIVLFVIKSFQRNIQKFWIIEYLL